MGGSGICTGFVCLAFKWALLRIDAIFLSPFNFMNHKMHTQWHIMCQVGKNALCFL
jgi:hypothetical protein